MLFRTIRAWLLPGARPARRALCRRGLRFYHPSIDPLEDRRLLSASSPLGPQSQEIAAVVARSIFYNNSWFDNNNPAANAADDGAIAIDKQALLPGQTATLANYTSYRGGINGIMVDIAGLAAVPTVDDFLFHVGNSNDSRSWAAAPAPASITVRPGVGVDGSARVTIVWPDGAIMNQWLQVGVRSSVNTGLARTDFFYFGNAVGESGNRSNSTIVDTTDQLAVRNNETGLNDPVSVLSTLDYNRDGLVSPADEWIARRFAVGGRNSLRLIAAAVDPAWTNVVARHVFYNHSQFDGNDPAASALDDGAIATDKVALLPGGTATFANYTSYPRGINGLIIDIDGLTHALSADDFEFKVGNGNQPGAWTQAPQPAISQRTGAGAYGAARVTLTWPDGAIKKQWLQVAVKATAKTGLSVDDVFYFGNAIGETGDSPANAYVGLADVLRVRAAIAAPAAPIDSSFDINRDGLVDAADEDAVRANYVATASSLSLLQLAPDAPTWTALETAFADFVSADVVGRSIFYNNSNFDGANPAADAADDLAIATDKSALLPGQTAIYANYTNYSRGINGIFVDVDGLPATPTTDDFVFRVGGATDPLQWSAAPQPLSITVRAGAGVGGAARITIVWPDGAIQQQWLQVTVKAGARTGLQHDDVFYFGNAIGESGNSVTDARVDVTDQLAARNRPYTFMNTAPITAVSDYNRDGLVDLADEWIVVGNLTSQGTLRLLTAPAAVSATLPQREQIELFNRGDSAYNVFYAPTLVKTAKGTVLAIAEGRFGQDDFTSYALVVRRSFDGGQSWSPISTIYNIPPNTGQWIGNPSAVIDSTTGQILLLFVKDNSTVFITKSSDDGLTWSAPVEITSSTKVTGAGNPNPAAFDSTPWGWYATGPGHGIQIQSGPYAGRLMIASDHRLTEDRSGPSYSHVIYSDDHGQTWHLGGGLDQTNPINDFANEVTIVEQTDGGLYMSVRINDHSPYRGLTRSYDGGMTWSTMQREEQLRTYPVEASLLRVNENTVLLSAPDSSDGTRHQMTIWLSRDNMVTWTKTKTVFFGYSGYSDMVLVGPDTVLLAYNRGHAGGNSFQSTGLARFNLRWLESEDPYQFHWNFNEKSPGERANIDGTSIQDYGPWDARARAQAITPEGAPVYTSGVGGNTALRLTSGSDSVMLTPPYTNALQFAPDDSFTVEITLRTLDFSGAIIAAEPDAPGWTLRLADGLPQFSLADSTHPLNLTGSTAINDGAWHRIAVVRDVAMRRVSLYVDGVLAAAPVFDLTTSTFESIEPVRLGADNDGGGQLAFDVDTLRLTRAALVPQQFLAADFVEPPRFATPARAAGGPDAIPGLQFWLPAYDHSRNFADFAYSDPVPVGPVEGTSVHSAVEASASGYRLTLASEMREVLYTNDATVGPSWLHAAVTAAAGQAWTVQDSNGTGANNFDFVQNTGVFTLSTFIKPGAGFGSSMALFDTAESTSANSGFSLMLTPSGALTMLIVGPDATIRFSQSTYSGMVAAGSWYHVAVVGNGPGSPVTFYVTPVSHSMVMASVSSQVITGADGDYPTDADHNLSIGSFSFSGNASYNGQMVDQSIYNRALTAGEIQQLFDYTKKD